MKKNPIKFIIVLLLIGAVSITGYHFHVKETDYKELYEISLQADWDMVNFFEMIMDLKYAEKVAFFSDGHEKNILNQLETYTQMIEQIVHNRYYQNKGIYYVRCLNEIKNYEAAVFGLKQIYSSNGEHDTQINDEIAIRETHKHFLTETIMSENVKEKQWVAHFILNRQINDEIVIRETYKDFLTRAVVRENAKEKQWVKYFNLDNTFFQAPILSDIELSIKRIISDEKTKQGIHVRDELVPIDNAYYELTRDHVVSLENASSEAALVEFVGSEEMNQYVEALKNIIEQEFNIISILPISSFNIDIDKCIFAMRQAEKIYLTVNDNAQSMEEKIRKAKRYKYIYRDIFVLDISQIGTTLDEEEY